MGSPGVRRVSTRTLRHETDGCQCFCNLRLASIRHVNEVQVHRGEPLVGVDAHTTTPNQNDIDTLRCQGLYNHSRTLSSTECGAVHRGLPARRGLRLLYVNLSCRLLGGTDSALASSASSLKAPTTY
jgi:hypothetical protein